MTISSLQHLFLGREQPPYGRWGTIPSHDRLGQRPLRVRTDDSRRLLPAGYHLLTFPVLRRNPMAFDQHRLSHKRQQIEFSTMRATPESRSTRKLCHAKSVAFRTGMHIVLLRWRYCDRARAVTRAITSESASENGGRRLARRSRPAYACRAGNPLGETHH